MPDLRKKEYFSTVQKYSCSGKCITKKPRSLPPVIRLQLREAKTATHLPPVIHRQWDLLGKKWFRLFIHLESQYLHPFQTQYIVCQLFAFKQHQHYPRTGVLRNTRQGQASHTRP